MLKYLTGTLIFTCIIHGHIPHKNLQYRISQVIFPTETKGVCVCKISKGGVQPQDFLKKSSLVNREIDRAESHPKIR